MSKIEKLLAKMHANPRDWHMQELEIIAKHYGLMIRKSGGSHVVFTHPDWVEMLCIPSRRPIKPVYIKKLLQLLETLEGNHET